MQTLDFSLEKKMYRMLEDCLVPVLVEPTAATQGHP